MAGQTIKVKNGDFSNTIFDPIVSRIEFANRASASTTATFSASQFDNVHIADNVIISGSAVVNKLLVNGGSLDASGWIFQNWTAGKDLLQFRGSSADDAIVGSSQDDIIFGGKGGDKIIFSAGSDRLSGGKGDDFFIADNAAHINAATRVDGGKGGGDTFAISLAASDTVLFRNVEVTGVEKVAFESFGQAIFSSAQLGSDAGQIHELASGDDPNQFRIAVRGSFDMGDVILTGFSNQDQIAFQGSNLKDVITGSALGDEFFASKGKDVLRGGDGDDVFIFSETNSAAGQTLRGDAGNDTFVMGSQNLKGLKIDGGAGNVDTIAIPSTGDEDILADFRKAKLEGIEALTLNEPGGPSDFTFVQLKSSQIAGSSGLDTVVKDFDIGRALLRVVGEDIDLTSVAFLGWSDDDAIILQGTRGNDTIVAPDLISFFSGKGGDDTLTGGSEPDVITGDAGRDLQRGNGGDDTFLFLSVKDSLVGNRRDIIFDFEAGADILDMSAIDANIKTAGFNDEFTFIGSADFSKTAGELRFEQRSGQGITLVSADVDGDGRADMQIELTGLIGLTQADFDL